MGFLNVFHSQYRGYIKEVFQISMTHSVPDRNHGLEKPLPLSQQLRFLLIEFHFAAQETLALNLIIIYKNSKSTIPFSHIQRSF